MAINYPGSLDDFTNPAAGNTLDSPSHSGQHSDLNDAVEALEAKVGIGASPAGSATAGHVLVAGTADTTWNQVGYEGITSGTATAGQVLTAQGGGTAIWESASLVYIDKETFTTVATVIFDNVFSTNYDNYRFLINIDSSSASPDIAIRMRAAGTAATGSNYYFQELNVASTTVSGVRVNADTSAVVGRSITTTGSIVILEIMNPYLTKNTNYASYGGYFDDPTIRNYTGSHRLTTSYDGIVFFPSTGTITGTITVYGYKK